MCDIPRVLKINEYDNLEVNTLYMSLKLVYMHITNRTKFIVTEIE